MLAAFLSLVMASAVAQAPDRTRPPKPGPPPSLALPAIRHLKLSNGLPVVFMEKKTVPVVQLVVVVKAGQVDEPSAKTGLASIAAAMLTDGAGARDALQLADASDYLGARLGASAGAHTTGVSIYAPVSRLDSAIALWADVTLRPTFPAAELERKRKERLTTLLQWRDQPSPLASVAFAKTVYPTHPYGAIASGTEAGLRSITTDDLKAFHATYFRPNNATIIVVGDVREKDIQRKLESAFGKWKTGKIPRAALPAVTQVATRELTIVDRPGSAQTEIRIGRVGAERRTDDYFALVVMNTILGGSFTSRLMTNLREQHGYAYGASSSFSFRPFPGPFAAGAGVQTEVTDSALVEFMKELRGIREPMPAEDVEKAKNYLALGYPGDFQSVSQIAGQLQELVVYDLPDAYFNEYTTKVMAVTPQDVQRVAQKYIDPDRMAIILVGDRGQIQDKVAALNLGPIKALTVEDVLGPAPEVKSPPHISPMQEELEHGALDRRPAP
jgi:predicted Zn-dependent peptidase